MFMQTLPLVGSLNQRAQITFDVQSFAAIYAGLSLATWHMQLRTTSDATTIALDSSNGTVVYTPSVGGVDATVTFQWPTSAMAALTERSYVFDFGFIQLGKDFEIVGSGKIELKNGVTQAGVFGTPSAPTDSLDTWMVLGTPTPVLSPSLMSVLAVSNANALIATTAATNAGTSATAAAASAAATAVALHNYQPLNTTIAPPLASFDAFGDSITGGYGASLPADCWVSLVGTALNITPTNHGVGGREVQDQFATIYPFNVSATTSQIITFATGTNDASFNSNTLATEMTFQFEHMAALAWLAIPATSKMIGQTVATVATITSLTSNGLGVATAQTSAPHGLTTDQGVFVIGATQTAYNALAIVTVIDSTHFTYPIIGTPTTPATTTGVITASGHGIVYGGTWANESSYYGGVLSKVSTTNGSTATFNMYGTVAYVAYGMQVSDGGTFSISVDGVLYNSYQTSGYLGGLMASGVFGTTHSSGLARIDGLAQGAHVIEVTVTSATSSSNHVWIDWVAAPSGVPTITGPQVIAQGVPLSFTDPTGGYTGLYTLLIKADVAKLVSDGLPIGYVDIPGCMNPYTDIYIDGVHPNNSGHANIAAAYLANLNSLATSGVKSGIYGAANNPIISPLQIIAGYNHPYTFQVGTGNNILGGGSTPGYIGTNAMLNIGFDNTIVGGAGNAIQNGTTNTSFNVISGGYENQIQYGSDNAIAGGTYNSIFSWYSTISGGSNNTINANYGTIAGGYYNALSGLYSWSPGGYYATDRGRYGVGVWASGKIATAGDAQFGASVLRGTGNSTTAIRVTADGATAGAANIFNIPNNTAYSISLTILIMDRTTGVKAKTWTNWAVLLLRGATVGSTSIAAASTPTPLVIGTFTGDAIAITADTTNGGLNISYTPPSGNTDTIDVIVTINSTEGQ